MLCWVAAYADAPAISFGTYSDARDMPSAPATTASSVKRLCTSASSRWSMPYAYARARRRTASRYGAGQRLGAELDLFGHLVRRQGERTEGAHLVGGEGAAGRDHDDRLHHLPEG